MSPPRTPGSRYLVLAAGWGLLGAAACASVFAISAIPPSFDGRVIPNWMNVLNWVLDLSMVPFCAVAPVFLVWSAYTCLRRAAGASIRWALAWCAAVSACLALETLFLIRLVHSLGTPYGANLRYMAWHAFDFSVGFLVTGAVMVSVLIAFRRRGVPAGGSQIRL